MNTVVQVINKGSVVEKELDLCVGPGDLVVDVLYNGVCKSDIKLYQGFDPFIADEFSGHEGLGRVIESHHPKFVIGDLVATYNHPCYTRKSVWKGNNCKKMYPIHDSYIYIIQPVACLAEALYKHFSDNIDALVLGSGYFAILTNLFLKNGILKGHYDFCGSYNKSFFDNLMSLPEIYNKGLKYDCIFDLSGKHNKVYSELLKEHGQYIIVANNSIPVQMNTFELSWKNVEILFPSPRSIHFMESMSIAYKLIQKNRNEILPLYKEIVPNELKEYLDNPRSAVKAVVNYT